MVSAQDVQRGLGVLSSSATCTVNEPSVAVICTNEMVREERLQCYFAALVEKKNYLSFKALNKTLISVLLYLFSLFLMLYEWERVTASFYNLN